MSLQSVQSRTQARHDGDHVADEPRQFPAVMRTDDACDYLCYRGRHRLRSLYRFLAKKGVPTRRRFRTVLIKKVDLDRALGGASPRQSRAVSR